MASEFDDLHDMQELFYSDNMTKATSRLIESELIMDRIFGTPFSGVPVHSGLSNVTALNKVFDNSKGFTEFKPAPRPQPPSPYTPSQEPVREVDPLSNLMSEFDHRAGGELLKQAPAPPRSQSRHFQPIIKIVSEFKSGLVKAGYQEEVMEPHWPAIVKSAMDFVSEAVEQV